MKKKELFYLFIFHFQKSSAMNIFWFGFLRGGDRSVLSGGGFPLRNIEYCKQPFKIQNIFRLKITHDGLISGKKINKKKIVRDQFIVNLHTKLDPY